MEKPARTRLRTVYRTQSVVVNPHLIVDGIGRRGICLVEREIESRHPSVDASPMTMTMHETRHCLIHPTGTALAPPKSLLPGSR